MQVATAKAIIVAEGVISGMVGEGELVGFWDRLVGEGDWEGNRLGEEVDEGERDGGVQAFTLEALPIDSHRFAFFGSYQFFS